jgi:CBS domain containing-hemolysin-like protein
MTPRFEVVFATTDARHEATIGGQLTEELGRVPEAGEVVHLDGVALEVVEVDDPDHRTASSAAAL